MKLKILILPIILVAVFWLFFSGNYVYLDENELTVTSSSEGSPILILEEEAYYVRYWTLAPGCYKLTRISLLDYNLATQTEESRCGVYAKSEN